MREESKLKSGKTGEKNRNTFNFIFIMMICIVIFITFDADKLKLFKTFDGNDIKEEQLIIQETSRIGGLNLEEESVLSLDFMEYRISEVTFNGVVTNVTTGYNLIESEEMMLGTTPTAFVKTLSNWKYTDSPDESTPLDASYGRSNCQGITMYIVDWLETNLPKEKNKYKLNIRTAVLEDGVNHMYPTIKVDGEEVEVWDMTVDKEEVVIKVKEFLRLYNLL